MKPQGKIAGAGSLDARLALHRPAAKRLKRAERRSFQYSEGRSINLPTASATKDSFPLGGGSGSWSDKTERRAILHVVRFGFPKLTGVADLQRTQPPAAPIAD